MNTQDASLMPQEINTEIEYVASKVHGLNILAFEHAILNLTKQIDTESCFCPNVTEYKSMDSMIHISVEATETEIAYQ